MGQIEVKIDAVVPLGDDPEWKALQWLVEFIEADPEDLLDLFSPKKPGFAQFSYVKIHEVQFFPPRAPSELKRLRRFHAEFVRNIRAVLAHRSSDGRTSSRMMQFRLTTRDASFWFLFYSNGELRSHFQGSWKMGFLSRVTFLLGRFGKYVKLCTGCDKIFAAEHGNQDYCSRSCNERTRQQRYRAKKIATPV